MKKKLRILGLVILYIFVFVVGYLSYDAYKLAVFLRSSTGQTATTTNQSALTLDHPINILLLGSDNDQKFSGNPLTQTMIVVHLDPQQKVVSMFSIPRDLWVLLPDGSTYGKIDQAAGYGGIPDAVKVVEETFGIQIDHYAWVGLNGFIKSINAVGGINLDVLHPVLDNAYPTDINDPNPYGIQRLYIQAGMQHFTGEEALQYVRSRHQEVMGDFGRTQRQRQLLLAGKTELLSKDLLLSAPSLLDGLQDQVKTDMSALYGIQLGYFYLKNQPLTEKQYTLSPPIYSHLGNSTDNQSIIIADPQKTADLVGSIFGSEAAKTTLQKLSTVKNIKL